VVEIRPTADGCAADLQEDVTGPQARVCRGFPRDDVGDGEPRTDREALLGVG
jgi:hypothetical protein